MVWGMGMGRNAGNFRQELENLGGKSGPLSD